MNISQINGNQIKDTSAQERLVSGTNIKTINGGSIVGSGNLPIAESTAEVVDKKARFSNDLSIQGATIPQESVPNKVLISQAQPNNVNWSKLKTINNQVLLGDGNLDLTTQQDLAQGLATRMATGSVTGSTSEVSGATEIKSLRIEGTDYNLPSGGGGGGKYLHVVTIYINYNTYIGKFTFNLLSTSTYLTSKSNLCNEIYNNKFYSIGSFICVPATGMITAGEGTIQYFNALGVETAQNDTTIYTTIYRSDGQIITTLALEENRYTIFNDYVLSL